MQEFLDRYHIVILIIEWLYYILTIALAGKIIMDTKTSSKTLAYLMLIVFLPFVGIAIYFIFGVNYRKNRFYSFKIERNEELYQRIKQIIQEEHHSVLKENGDWLKKYRSTTEFLYSDNYSPLTSGNHVEVLKNGEEKFPKVKEILQQAKHHIHLEYYIYNNDIIGNEIAEILIQKAKEGVVVRFLYDDFGSSKLTKQFLKKLNEGGLETSPVNKVRYKLLANRINYRDHRKIVIVDGLHVFTGGVNVSDKYINPNPTPTQYWRDTHLYIKGKSAFYFQFLFMSNWMFATEKMLPITADYFDSGHVVYGNTIVQGSSSGPDTRPSIMMSTTSAIYSANERIYITTPYFIPTESILFSIKQQALAGVDVRLLVPKEGDSRIVNAAAYSYYRELLESNVKIYFYTKGFVHAKTMLVDHDFSCVGTANMDVRSQELNFEVNTLVYNQEVNSKLYNLFLEDLQNSEEVTLDQWNKRSKMYVFFEHLARLLSPLM